MPGYRRGSALQVTTSERLVDFMAPAEAVVLAERAVRVYEAIGASPEVLARSRAVLARALWNAPSGQGRDRDRAAELARQAREVFRMSKGIDKHILEVEALLAGHKRTRRP